MMTVTNEDQRSLRRSARKRSAVVLLAGLNVILLLALLTPRLGSPAAFAQPGPRGPGYLCVTAKPAGQTYDVLYLLDPAAQKLHAFYPGLPQNRQLTRAEPRDLKKDFGD